MIDDGVRRGEREILEKLLAYLEQDAEDEHVREMAADVRRGGVPLQDAIAVEAYEQPLGRTLPAFLSWYQALEPGSLEEHLDRCCRQIDEIEEHT